MKWTIYSFNIFNEFQHIRLVMYCYRFGCIQKKINIEYSHKFYPRHSFNERKCIQLKNWNRIINNLNCFFMRSFHHSTFSHFLFISTLHNSMSIDQLFKDTSYALNIFKCRNIHHRGWIVNGEQNNQKTSIHICHFVEIKFILFLFEIKIFVYFQW